MKPELPSTHSPGILKVRRHYNQWVADQTLEDYALRFTARRGRKMSISLVGKTALGATAFLALESLAAVVTLSYGFTNAVAAMFAVCAVFFITGFPIAYASAKHGLDIDLLTRGAGFGYLGSTITSLIYASFTFIFFAIEAAILSSALNLVFGVPFALGYLLCAVAVIPIVTSGITSISKFQSSTQTFWLVLQIGALFIVLLNEWQQLSDWVKFSPVQQQAQPAFSWALFGAASAIFFALIAQIGEQVDYLRFMPEKTKSNRKQWWFWVVLSGPGWVSMGLIKMLLGSFLAFIAIKEGVSFVHAADPTLMYQRAFGYIIHSDKFALILAGLLVIIAQMKINVTNAYAGSIAWSNFFSRLTHTHPGRVVWLVFNVSIALLLMELGIHKALESILSVFSLVAISWLCSLSADLLINKNLGLSPKIIEFKRGYLYDINPVGVGSMLLATTIGIATYLGALGDWLQPLAHFVCVGICFVAMPLLAWLTKGEFYIARTPKQSAPGVQQKCSICENEFEPEDMLFCPAYQQTICSLCCSLDVRCLDQCKPEAKYFWSNWPNLGKHINSEFGSRVFQRLSRFVLSFALTNLIISCLLLLIYRHIELVYDTQMTIVAHTLWILFFVLMIVSGVITWLFLLAHESRSIAQQESNTQTKRLLQEIDAHQLTDLELQTAKELAESANAAKSRYLSGISHELRTPLQTILGYSDLLQERDTTPLNIKRDLKIVHRSGQYLADLIEGLLDVSKIEAGRLDLHVTQVALPELIDQVATMVRMQAAEKNIEFKLIISDPLPKRVKTDEKRLRQILINLLTNAVKYTQKGSVTFSVSYRSQVAYFSVKDTGLGIPASDHQSIFLPFERVKAHSQIASGTGLGLTIVRLLTEIMGGDLQFSSEVNVGSEFKVSLMLPWLVSENSVSFENPIVGYQGEKKTLLLVDDDDALRGMLNSFLQPIGFEVLEANNAFDGLRLATSKSVDLMVLDVSMPEKNGFELATELRSLGVDYPILMLSANALPPSPDEKLEYGYNDYLVKPIQNTQLLERIGAFLQLEWRYKQIPAKQSQVASSVDKIKLPHDARWLSLNSSIDIGYKKGVVTVLNEFLQTGHLNAEEFARLMSYAELMNFNELLSNVTIEESTSE